MLGYDEARAWLLLADAGMPVGDCGNPPVAWLAHAREHLVPYLEAVAGVAGSWDGLLAGVRQAGEELMAIEARIEPEHARVMVPTYVVDRDLVSQRVRVPSRKVPSALI